MQCPKNALVSLRNSVLVWICIGVFNINAFAANPADSIQIPKPNRAKNTVKALIIPTVLIGYGVAAIGDNFLYDRHDAYNFRNNNFPNFRTHVDDYLVYTPTVAAYALDVFGLKSKNNFVDRTIMLASASIITEATVLGLKEGTHMLRPDNSAYNSFPSGHTAFAFSMAEFLHQEYKDESPWISVAGYSAATATGALRMLNNRHWLSDVCVGAGIGMLSTKFVYATYPWFKNKVTHGKGMVLAPTYYNGQAQMIFVMQF
jgi:hypothetical protein